MKSKWMRIPALCLALLLLGTAATVLPGAAELSVVFEENFDEYEGDVNASATKLATFFHVDANAIGDGYVRVEEDPSNGNLYLKNHDFTQVYSKTGIRDPYEFAMTVYEMQGGHQAGVFFRAPACECAYYEGDGGDPDNQTSTGRSGIWVFVYRDRISVNIKAFDNSKPAKVANIYHAFPLPEGSDYGKGIELRIIDNGTDAQIMADGTLVCTLKFSEETGRKWTQNGIDRAFENAAIEKAVENMTVEIPDSMVEEELDQELERMDYELRSQGASLQAYAQMIGGSMDTMRNSLRPSALHAVKTNVMLDAVVDAEKLEVTDEECEEEYKRLADSYKLEVEKVKEILDEKGMRGDLQVKKAAKLIADSAVAVPVKKDEETKAE